MLTRPCTIAISETLEANLQIGDEVLDTMVFFEQDDTALIESFREKYYG